MRKLIFGLMLILTISSIVACSNKDTKNTPIVEKGSDISNSNKSTNSSSNDSSSSNENQDKTAINTSDNKSSDKNTINNNKVLTQKEVLSAIGEQIKTNLNINLPSSLPLSKSEHLTAVTKSSKDSYSIVFYKNSEPIPINNKKLVDGSSTAIEIARFQAQKANSQKESDEKISFEQFNNLGGQEIDLGHGIKGFQDAGAGSVFTSWNEGRWALTVRTLTSQNDKGVELAKKSVEFLEKNTLPIPKQYGKIHLDTEQNGNISMWQDGKIVYTLDKVKNPIYMLDILVKFK